jgi:hypothetical protein
MFATAHTTARERAMFAGVSDETAQRKWQRILGEYAIARAEYQIAYQVFATRPRSPDVAEWNSSEFLAEQESRAKLLRLRDQMAKLEADSWLDAPGAIAD